MTRSMSVLALTVMTVFTSSCMSRKQSAITQGELVRNAQEMFDAVAAGNQGPGKNISRRTRIEWGTVGVCEVARSG